MEIEAPCEKCLVKACCTNHSECDLFDKYVTLYSLSKGYITDDNKGKTVNNFFNELLEFELITISEDKLTISMNIEKHLDENHMSGVRLRKIEELKKEGYKNGSGNNGG